MSRYSHIVYLLIILVLAGWFMLAKQHPNMRAPNSAPFMHTEPHQASHAHTEPQTNHANQAELNALIARVHELERDRARLEQLLEQRDQQLANNEVNERVEESRRTLQVDQMSQEELNALFKSVPPGVLTADEVKQRLATEPADDEWAYNLDILVQDLILTHNELSNLKLENVKCTTSLCAVDLSSYDKSKNFDMMNFHQVISNAGVVNNPTHNSLIMLNSDDNSVRWVISKLENGGH